MKLYLIQNQEGKFFRAKGYGGSGKSWVDKMEDAKFYTKIGQAKSRVTFFYKNYPEYGCPRLLEIDLSDTMVKFIEMENDTKVAIKKMEKRKVQDRIREINHNIKIGYSRKEDWDKKLERLQEELKGMKIS